jgi:hypothetical protein
MDHDLLELLKAQNTTINNLAERIRQLAAEVELQRAVITALIQQPAIDAVKLGDDHHALLLTVLETLEIPEHASKSADYFQAAIDRQRRLRNG